MDAFSFPRYLAAKRSVDDRALNSRVWNTLASWIQDRPAKTPLRVLEVGAGTGTMIQRMAEAGLLDCAVYTALDAEAENMRAACQGLLTWAEPNGWQAEEMLDGVRLTSQGRELRVTLLAQDLFDFLPAQGGSGSWDVLVANAFLDLVDVPGTLPRLRELVRPGGLLYFSINFDGMTALEPAVDPALDEQIIALYHRSMDERRVAGALSGDSRSGRHLFQHLREAGLELLEAGSSDWVVTPRGGGYPADEAYFLGCILHFFESSLRGRVELPAGALDGWLAARREQIRRGELVYIAHQLDTLARRSAA